MASAKSVTRLLYIDANAYLRFYDNIAREYKKLLNSMVELNDHIFVTSQIEHEVCRNKLSVFVSSYKQQIDQFKFIKSALPIHLISDKNKEIEEWNKKTAAIDKDVEGQRKSLQNLAETIIESISNEEDDVSMSLYKIFSKKRSPTDQDLDAAAQRKLTGNPPGKQSDPLGDQISWELLLKEVKSADELFLISSDSDYLTTYSDKSYLNPLLRSDLRESNRNLEVFCFATLAKGLEAFNGSQKIRSLPTEEELGNIEKEEQYSTADRYFDSGSISPLIGDIYANTGILPTRKYLRKVFGPLGESLYANPYNAPQRNYHLQDYVRPEAEKDELVNFGSAVPGKLSMEQDESAREDKDH